MAKKVKIASVAGSYAVTQDGQMLRMIGNIKPQQYAYTDGVVCYGFGQTDNYTQKFNPKRGGLPVYINIQDLPICQVEFTTEKLDALKQYALIQAGPTNSVFPILYNTDNKCYCWESDTATSTDYIQRYKDDRGGYHDFRGVIVRWRGDTPDLQTGEYLRNDAYTYKREWTAWPDAQAGTVTYTYIDHSSSGWIANDTPLPSGNLNTLEVNGNRCNLDSVFSAILSDLQSRQAVVTVPTVPKPPAQLGKFCMYKDDACSEPAFDSLYSDKRLVFDGAIGVFNIVCCGIYYAESSSHPLNPDDPSQGNGWWPQECIYKVRAVWDVQNNNLRIVYMTFTENGQTTTLIGDSGYHWQVDGWEWNSLTGDLTKDQETIYSGADRPQAVTEEKNILFKDRIQPPVGSQLQPIQVNNYNESLVFLNDWKKVERAVFGL